MIIAERKPLEDIRGMITGYKKIQPFPLKDRRSGLIWDYISRNRDIKNVAAVIGAAATF